MSYFTKRSKRIVAGTLAGALALSVSPILGFTGIASAADALPPIAEPIGDGNFCEDGPTTEPFTDVSASDPSLDEIICLVATELTTGTTATTYSPNASITRRQMALFVKRLADLANELDTGTQVAALPAYDGTTAPFTDIGGESTAAKEAIGQLQQAGIVAGTTATTYSPGANVTRRQMAAFVNNLEKFLTGAAFTTTKDFFNDDTGDTGEANLNAVASVGIFQGDGAGNVFPGANLTRRQMANVLLRDAQVMLEQGDIKRAFPEDDTNQSFTASPAGVIQVAIPAGGTVPGSFVDFSGLTGVNGGNVDISLLPVGDSDVDPYVTVAGQVSFLDEDLDGIADGTELIDDERSSHGVNHSNPDIFITSVNGIGCSGSQFCDDVAIAGNGANIRLDYDTNPTDSAWVLVWDDLDGDDVLDLNATNQPTEPFGIAGPVFTNAGEALLGDCQNDDVYYVDKDANRIWLMDEDGRYIQYGNAGDTYSYDDYIALNATQFEAHLSVGDNLYFPDLCYTPGGPNEFALEDLQANMPTGLATTVGDFDASVPDTASNDVRLTWSAPNPTNGFVDEYDIYRGGVFLATVTGATTYDDEDLAAGTYVYRVESITHDQYGSSSRSETTSATVAAAPPGPVVGAPESDAAVFTDPNTNGLISTGDTLVVTFNEPMAAPGVGDMIEVTDADGTVVTITNGTNATFVLSGNGATLTITLTGAPVTVVAGTTAGAAFGDVTDTSGNVDANEALEWDLVASTDVTF